MKFGKPVDDVEKMTRAEIDAYILECMRRVKKRTIKKGVQSRNVNINTSDEKCEITILELLNEKLYCVDNRLKKAIIFITIAKYIKGCKYYPAFDIYILDDIIKFECDIYMPADKITRYDPQEFNNSISSITFDLKSHTIIFNNGLYRINYAKWHNYSELIAFIESIFEPYNRFSYSHEEIVNYMYNDIAIKYTDMSKTYKYPPLAFNKINDNKFEIIIDFKYNDPAWFNKYPDKNTDIKIVFQYNGFANYDYETHVDIYVDTILKAILSSKTNDYEINIMGDFICRCIDVLLLGKTPEDEIWGEFQKNCLHMKNHYYGDDECLNITVTN